MRAERFLTEPVCLQPFVYQLIPEQRTTLPVGADQRLNITDVLELVTRYVKHEPPPRPHLTHSRPSAQSVLVFFPSYLGKSHVTSTWFAENTKSCQTFFMLRLCFCVFLQVALRQDSVTINISVSGSVTPISLDDPASEWGLLLHLLPINIHLTLNQRLLGN